MPLILAVLVAVSVIFSGQKASLQSDPGTGRGSGASNDCFPKVVNLIAG